VLIIAISTMVLVSIHPFAIKKIVLIAAALVGLSSALCFADPVFMSSQFAPRAYHRRAAPAAVLSASLGSGKSFSASTASLDSAVNWLACNSE
jgi:hypothetical protein